MRYNVLSRNSTKAERKFYELLKASKIPFRHRWLIGGREVDFLVGKYAIEIDSHAQDVEKNKMLVREGYVPLHIKSGDIGDYLKLWLINLYGRN